MAFRRALLQKSPRTLAVLNLAAEKAGWGKPLKPIAGRKVGRGVSCQFAFGSYMAQVAEVSVGAGRRRAACTAWCARSTAARTSTRTPSPRRWKAASCSAPAPRCGTRSRSTRAGSQQTNFNDYRVMRMNEAPAVEVYIVNSHDEPGGIGEPGTAGDRAGARERGVRGDGEAGAQAADRGAAEEGVMRPSSPRRRDPC